MYGLKHAIDFRQFTPYHRFHLVLPEVRDIEQAVSEYVDIKSHAEALQFLSHHFASVK